MHEDREDMPDFPEREARNEVTGEVQDPYESSDPVGVYDRPETADSGMPSLGAILIGLVVVLIVAFLLIQFVF